jgi:hypothetical protein
MARWFLRSTSKVVSHQLSVISRKCPDANGAAGGTDN